MRKTKAFFSAVLFLLVVTQLLDAAPRRRSRARRSAQQYTQTTTTNQATYTAQPQYYQQTNAASTIQAQAVQAPTYSVIQSQPAQQAQSTYAVAVASPNDVPSVPEVASEIVVPSPTPVAQAVQQQAYAAPAANAFQSGSVMAEVNAIRARRGLPGFVEDPALSSVAYQKASIQANRGSMGHPGGSMGGARYEGVGMGNQFTTCYLYSNVSNTAGAASVVGANGQRYHCLLVR